MLDKIIKHKLNLDCVCEYRFDDKRKFRFDYAIPSIKCAIEIEGGIYSGGRHVRGNGYAKDCEKYNLATIQGWSILRYPKICGEIIRDISLLINQ